MRWDAWAILIRILTASETMVEDPVHLNRAHRFRLIGTIPPCGMQIAESVGIPFESASPRPAPPGPDSSSLIPIRGSAGFQKDVWESGRFRWSDVTGSSWG